MCGVQRSTFMWQTRFPIAAVAPSTGARVVIRVGTPPSCSKLLRTYRSSGSVAAESPAHFHPLCCRAAVFLFTMRSSWTPRRGTEKSTETPTGVPVGYSGEGGEDKALSLRSASKHKWPAEHRLGVRAIIPPAAGDWPWASLFLHTYMNSACAIVLFLAWVLLASHHVLL